MLPYHTFPTFDFPIWTDTIQKQQQNREREKKQPVKSWPQPHTDGWIQFHE